MGMSVAFATPWGMTAICALRSPHSHFARQQSQSGRVWTIGALAGYLHWNRTETESFAGPREKPPTDEKCHMIANTRMLAAFVLLLATALMSLAASAQQAAQNPRIALVIGNATYRDAALATTANDAGLIAQTLQAAGFDVVGARDLDGQSLRTAFRDFLDKASAAGPDMQAFVYLAGRGVQYNGDNYFVPVDAQINRDADVPIDALRISDFAHALAQTPGKARIIVLDAARANPYASQGSPLAPGLALVDPEPGELIAFNAAPGTLAGDEQGPYGVFGKTLAGAMRQGGVDVVEVFDQTRVTVNQETQGALLPWSASKLTEPYYIFERAADAPPPAVAATVTSQPIAGLPADAAYAAALQRDTIRGYEEYLAHYPDSAQARRVRAILAALREAYFWRRSVNANTAHAYWTYLRRYPSGPHVADARRRLSMISAAYEPPPDFQPMTYQDLPPPPPDEDFYEAQPIYAFDSFGPPPLPPPPEYYPQYYYVEDDDWRDLPPPPPPVDVGLLPVLAIGIPLIAGAVAFQHYESLPSRWSSAGRPAAISAAAAWAATAAAQRNSRAAAPSRPGPGYWPCQSPRQTVAAYWPSSGAARETTRGNASCPFRGGKPPAATPVVTAPPGGRLPAAATAPPGAKPLPVARPGAGREASASSASCACVGQAAYGCAWRACCIARCSGGDAGRKTAGRGDRSYRRKAAAGRAQHRDSFVGSSGNASQRKGAWRCDTASWGQAAGQHAHRPHASEASAVPPPPVVTTPNTTLKPPPKPGPAPPPALNLAPKPGANPPSIAPVVPRAAPPPVVRAPSPAAPVVHAPPPPVVHAPPPPVVHAPPPPVVRGSRHRRRRRWFTHCRRHQPSMRHCAEGPDYRRAPSRQDPRGR